MDWEEVSTMHALSKIDLAAIHEGLPLWNVKHC